MTRIHPQTRASPARPFWRGSTVHAATLLAIALSIALLWQHAFPRWLALASLGISVAAGALFSVSRLGGPRTHWTLSTRRAEANPGTGLQDHWVAFVRTAQPFVPRRAIRELRRAIKAVELYRGEMHLAEAEFYRVAGKTAASAMVSSPALKQIRDAIAVASIEEAVATARLDAHALAIRKAILKQLRAGDLAASAYDMTGTPMNIRPEEWQHFDLDESLQAIIDIRTGAAVLSHLTLAHPC